MLAVSSSEIKGRALLPKPARHRRRGPHTPRTDADPERGNKRLNIDAAAPSSAQIAILGGAMTWVRAASSSAISNAGGFGVIACGSMSPELLDTEIAETKQRTRRPFGVNLITMHPDLTALIDTCAKHRVTHVVLAGGLPPGGAIDRIKSSGAKLIGFAPALSLAKKLMRSGADALVIEGMEAGGQIGRSQRPSWRRKSDQRAKTSGFSRRRHREGEAMTLPGGRGRGKIVQRFVCATKASPTPISRRCYRARPASDPSFHRPAADGDPVRAEEPRDGKFRREQREVAQSLTKADREAEGSSIEHYWRAAQRAGSTATSQQDRGWRGYGGMVTLEGAVASHQGARDEAPRRGKPG